MSSAASVTGGPEPASVAHGLLEYKAVQRAAKRPAILRPTDTTLDPGCTPEQVGGCIRIHFFDNFGNAVRVQ